MFFFRGSKGPFQRTLRVVFFGLLRRRFRWCSGAQGRGVFWCLWRLGCGPIRFIGGGCREVQGLGLEGFVGLGGGLILVPSVVFFRGSLRVVFFGLVRRRFRWCSGA